MALASKQPVIAVTLGDPAGIGPEIVAKTLRDSRLPKGFRWEILGAAKKGRITPGKSTRTSARIALEALEQAVEGCRSGRFAAVVTGPVQKKTLAQIEPGFVGQTEFLARRCGRPDGNAVMVLTDSKLTVALCTQHCALKEALRRLSSARIVRVARQTADFLRRLGRRNPRLALAGINPHAGENGLFGDEEERLLRPALRTLRRAGYDVSGPHSPDTVRRGHLRLPRPGADSVQIGGVSKRRQRHVGAADHPHVARSWHRARSRRKGKGRSPKHAGRRAAGLPVGEGKRLVIPPRTRQIET
jgi:4-hydroxythreonine-4-phosphate dehydrogenase